MASAKPEAKLIGANGNIFNLMGIASEALKRAGLKEQATEMFNKVQQCKSYDEALVTIMEYVEVV